MSQPHKALIHSFKRIRNDVTALKPDDEQALIRIGAFVEKTMASVPEETPQVLHILTLCAEGLQMIYQKRAADGPSVACAIAGAAMAMEQLLLSKSNGITENRIDQTIHALEAALGEAPREEGTRTEPVSDEEGVDPPATPVASGTESRAMEDEDDIVTEFLIESYENLDRLDQDLIEMEQNPSSPETLGSVFRTLHTLKGSCGFLNFPKLESVAHAGEDLLSRMRDGEITLTPGITSALLTLVDAVRDMLAHIEKTKEEGDTDYTALTERLTQLERNAAAPPPEAASSVTGDDSFDPLDRFGDLLIKSGATSPEAVRMATQEQERGDPRHIGEILVERQAVRPQDVTEALKTQEATRGPGVSNSNIRINVELLDTLMNLVGELVLARNQILQFTATEKDITLLGASQRLNLITTELQEGVMKTRMQPIGNIWGKFPRVVRDLAVSCGKRIRIEMEGKNTELDKTIIEAIKDPLTHLIRNAVDHGVEDPETRVARGKPVEGCLCLRAFHAGGQVNIEITDDGAGIDPDGMRQQAVRRNLITPEQATRMGEREAVNLVFRPGFSTATTVTNVSGRGVGMDVVKANIEKIGGTVDVRSRVGQGTSVKIKIPLTLAIVPALVVTSGGDSYAIPQVNLLELVRLEGRQAKKDVEMIHGTPVYRLRGNLLPLVYLDRALQTATDLPAGPDAEQEALNIVVLQADDRPFGLIVAGINDTEEIVVKPLGKQLKRLSVFAGATIMGDGSVALILDVTGIAQHAGVISEVHDRAAPVDTSARAEEDREDHESLLLFEVEHYGRMAIPLSMVARLEEFPTSVLERAGNRRVVQYREGILPLIFLSDVFGTTPTEKDPLQVIVFSDQGRSMGLVVDRILDVVDETLKMQDPGAAEGVLGAAVIQERVTDVLDVHGIIRTIDPAFFDRPVAA